MRNSRHGFVLVWPQGLVPLVMLLLLGVLPLPTQAALLGDGAFTQAGSTDLPRVYLPVIFAKPVAPVEPNDWPMAGANPQRTSWTPEEVRGALSPIWYRPIEPYIAQNVQVIAAYGLLYVSTARGLIALDAETGDLRWSYPTELPLGHSPTIDRGVAYVAGLDHRLYAIDAMSGGELWAFEGGAGFQTSPLVVGGRVYVGNRDGYMYAVHAHGNPEAGKLSWKYKTGGPILFSAAYQDNTIYFASNDSYAYALNAGTGALIWKSGKLRGAGFASWWPVIAGEQVVFAGSPSYRPGTRPGILDSPTYLDRDDLYPNRTIEPRGTFIGATGSEPGAWVQQTRTVDASRVMNYFETKPWRRTYFVLNRSTGQEYAFDADHDGRPEYAPIPWHGTQSGTRFPPIVGYDGVLYQSSDYQSDPWIPSGHVSGWKFGTQFISIPTSKWCAIDESLGYSAGGRLIYWVHGGDEAGAFDISTTSAASEREWIYFSYNLDNMLPGYSIMYDDGPALSYATHGPYGGINGVYSEGADVNPPVPYHGKLYLHTGNSIVAFGKYEGVPRQLPLLRLSGASPKPALPPTTAALEARLAYEVGEILKAGHLRPGYASAGLFGWQSVRECGDNLLDYWHNPADTIYALTLALPHLPPDLQASTKAYLAAEFASYPPYAYTHIGWRDGAAREAFDLPPEAEADREFSSQQACGS